MASTADRDPRHHIQKMQRCLKEPWAICGKTLKKLTNRNLMRRISATGPPTAWRARLRSRGVRADKPAKESCPGDTRHGRKNQHSQEDLETFGAAAAKSPDLWCQRRHQ
jgi:hypothetical protein